MASLFNLAPNVPDWSSFNAVDTRTQTDFGNKLATFTRQRDFRLLTFQITLLKRAKPLLA
jgi:hypothetical protein